MKKLKLTNKLLILTFLTMISFSLTTYASGDTHSFTVSPGVTYENHQIEYEGMKENVNLLKIDLENPFSNVELFTPTPLDELITTTQQARINHIEGHRIVGAINAAFFTYETNMPLYLLMKANQIINAGILSSGSEYYVSQPVAFGIDRFGKAKISPFDLDLSFTHDEQPFTIESIDRPRRGNGIFLYTPNYSKETIQTNEYGIEFFVQPLNQEDLESINVGDKINVKVALVRPYGEKSQFSRPETGFILSASGGEQYNKLKHIQAGDELSIDIGMNQEWQDGQFMIGSGPVLVKDGQVALSMDPNSRRAKEKAPRTAVAIDEETNRVYFVTIDGRQTNSEGMNLSQFADYLASLGVDQALNLDGGGSTAMAVRSHGDVYANLINQPSDGRERKVSATLQVISSAMNGEPTTLVKKEINDKSILVGATINVKPDYLLDQYYNPLPILKSKLTYQLINQIGVVENDTFTALEQGIGKVTAQYDTAQLEMPITVVETPTELTINPPHEVLQKGETVSFKLEATDQQGGEILYNAEQVQWQATSQLKELLPGKYQVVNASGKATVTAKLGGKAVEATVWLGEDHLVLDTFDQSSAWNLSRTRAMAIKDNASGFEPFVKGTNSFKLTYDFRTGEKGTAAVYANPEKPIEIKGTPDSLGMWVYGDQSNNWLRGTVIDGEGKEHKLDFTSYNGLNWQGWRYVKAEVPNGVPLPLRLKDIYFAQSNENLKGTGVLFLDQLEAIYSNSYKGGNVEIPSYQLGSNDKVWSVKFNTTLSEETINSRNIYVLDKNGNKVPVQVSLGETKRIVKVKPINNYIIHNFYKLVITKQIKSVYDHNMINQHSIIFQVGSDPQ